MIPVRAWTLCGIILLSYIKVQVRARAFSSCCYLPAVSPGQFSACVRVCAVHIRAGFGFEHRNGQSDTRPLQLVWMTYWLVGRKLSTWCDGAANTTFYSENKLNEARLYRSPEQNMLVPLSSNRRSGSNMACMPRARGWQVAA